MKIDVDQNKRFYNPLDVEEKWQKYWEQKGRFECYLQQDKKVNYILEMFPYPSGNIHMGHVRNYVIGDVVARYKMIHKEKVLHPMGWDAFGLPAENAAIKHKVHPKKWIMTNIQNMKKQLKSLGLLYDWNKEIITCNQDYFFAEQQIFLNLYKKNHIYQKYSYVNWDPVDNTVLANEQVIDGKGWRSGAKIEKKKLKQWFMRITDYAEELLEDLNKLKGWSTNVKNMQKKWIGKSQGINVYFKIDSDLVDNVEIFTTRPETLYGASFCALSPQHPIAEKLAGDSKKIAEFIENCNSETVTQDELDCTEKKGIFTGLYVIHPLDEKIKLPLYIANFVLMEYGTGAVFGCPAHDQRDLEFAKKYNLNVKQVIQISEKNNTQQDYKNNQAMITKGIMCNSNELNGMDNELARKTICKKIEKLKIGKIKTVYRLRDWGISRQRYWGCPIPMIFCDDCGTVPVPTKDLPVVLPDNVEFTGNGNPLEQHPTWKYVNCPQCQKHATRCTDTLDTFFESSWYLFRYITPELYGQPFDGEMVDQIFPVKLYVGGIEHAVMHLLYVRYFTKLFRDCDYINFSEPVENLLTQGMVCHKTYKDKHNQWINVELVEYKKNKAYHKITEEEVFPQRLEKMSKSKLNGINPQKIIEQYGSDTARLFVMSDTPPEKDMEWSSVGVEAIYKYLSKFWDSLTFYASYANQIQNKHFSIAELNETNKNLLFYTHETIKYYQQDMEQVKLNCAVSRIRSLSNKVFELCYNGQNEQDKYVLENIVEALLVMSYPFVPHICEEIWMLLGNPESMLNSELNHLTYNQEYLVQNTVKLAIQVNGKLKLVHEIDVDLEKYEVEKIVMENHWIDKYVKDKKILKTIYVKNKIFNIVVEK